MKKLKYFFSVILILFVFTETINSQPNPPQNLTAALNPAPSNVLTVKLSWDGNGATTLVRYNVYRKFGAISDTGSFILKYPNLMHNTFFDHNVQPNKTYSYYVTAVNNLGQSEPSNMVEITIVPPQLLSHGKISGIVANDSTGLPIFRAKVKFIKVNNNFSKIVETNQNGFFTSVLPVGNYYIQTNAMGFRYEFYDNVYTIQEATQVNLLENDSLNFEIGLSPFVHITPTLFNISGTVVDDLNNPLKARLNLFRLRNNSHHNATFFAVTDSNGNFTLKAREGDTVVIFAVPFNHNFLPEYFDNKTNFNDADRIVVNGNISNINFTLERRPIFNNGISGTVKDSLENTVESMVIAIKKFTNSPNIQHRRYVVLNDSTTGEYSFNNLLPGEYILLAKPKANYLPTYFRYDGMPTLNWRFADSVVVSDNGVISNINFVVRQLPDSGFAKINGMVQNFNNELVNGAFVYAIDSENRIFAYAISDENGQFKMEGLIPGEYKIVCDMIGYEVSNKSLVIDYENNINQNLIFTIKPDNGITSINDDLIINEFSLNQNYPNPFNPSTVISFQISEFSHVNLKVYDILGNEVISLVNEEKDAGIYTVVFNGSELSSGVYFYQLRAGNFIQTRKMLMMK